MRSSSWYNLNCLSLDRYFESDSFLQEFSHPVLQSASAPASQSVIQTVMTTIVKCHPLNSKARVVRVVRLTMFDLPKEVSEYFLVSFFLTKFDFSHFYVIECKSSCMCVLFFVILKLRYV